MFGKKMLVSGLGFAVLCASVFAAPGQGARKHKGAHKAADSQATSMAASMPASAPAAGMGKGMTKSMTSVAWKAKLQERVAAYTDAQKAGVAKVQSDIAALKTGTADQAKTLSTDLQSLVTSETKPAAEKVDQLASDLQTQLNGKDVKDADQQQMAQDLEMVMNNANVPQHGEVNSAIMDVNNLLKTAGVAADQTRTLGKDMHAMMPVRAGAGAGAHAGHGKKAGAASSATDAGAAAGK